MQCHSRVPFLVFLRLGSRLNLLFGKRQYKSHSSDLATFKTRQVLIYLSAMRLFRHRYMTKKSVLVICASKLF